MSNVPQSSMLPVIRDDTDFIYDAGNNPGEATYITNNASEWAGCLQMLDIDNTAGTELIFIRFWDANHASPPTLGTAIPDLCLPCPAGVRLPYTFLRGDPGSDGTDQPYFLSGLWYNVSTINGSTGTPTDKPTVAPTLRMLFKKD